MRIFNHNLNALQVSDLNVYASFVQRYKVLSKHMRYDFVHMGLFYVLFQYIWYNLSNRKIVISFLKYLIWNNQKAILMFLHDWISLKCIIVWLCLYLQYDTLQIKMLSCNTNQIFVHLDCRPISILQIWRTIWFTDKHLLYFFWY